METVKIKLKTLMISSMTILYLELIFQFATSQKLLSALPGLGLLRTSEILAMLYIAWCWENSIKAIGLAPTHIRAGVKKGLLWSAGFGMVAGFIFILLLLKGINPFKLVHTSLPARHRDLFLIFLIGGIVGPLAEEIFFRGILYGYLRRWGAVPAIILSTLFFVLTHPARQSLPVAQLAGGLVFAVSYEVEKNLMVPIIIHVTGNMALFALSWIQ